MNWEKIFENIFDKGLVYRLHKELLQSDYVYA